MTGLAEQCAEFGFRERKSHVVEDGEDIVVAKFEGDPQLLQHDVVGQRQLHRQQRTAFVSATTMDDQPVEKVGEDAVAAGPVTWGLFAFEEGDDIVPGDFQTGQAGDVGDTGVADVEHVANAAQYVVVDHFHGSVAGQKVKAPQCGAFGELRPVRPRGRTHRHR
ncbi:hypothetical protein D9M68_849540 [compost metagenome]